MGKKFLPKQKDSPFPLLRNIVKEKVSHEKFLLFLTH